MLPLYFFYLAVCLCHPYCHHEFITILIDTINHHHHGQGSNVADLEDKRLHILDDTLYISDITAGQEVSQRHLHHHRHHHHHNFLHHLLHSDITAGQEVSHNHQHHHPHRPHHHPVLFVQFEILQIRSFTISSLQPAKRIPFTADFD